MKKDFFKCIANILLVFLILISNVSFAVYGEDAEEAETETKKEQITVTVYLADGFSIEGSDETTIESIVNEDGYINPVNINLDEDMAESFSDDLLTCLNEFDTFKNNNLSATYDKDTHVLTISGTPSESVEINLNDILSKIVEENNGYKDLVPEEGSTDEPTIEVITTEENSGTTIYVSNSGNNINDGSSSENAVADLSTAYSKVSTNGTIILLSNIEQSSTLNLNSNKTVTITSGNNNVYSIKRGSSFNNTLLNITSGSITLSNITVDGSNKGSDFLVKVGDASNNPTLTLDDKATITNNKTGGILVGVSKNKQGYGTLNIKSGSKISNMNGCGRVHIDDSTSTTASAVLVMGSNTFFNMEGGEISDNNGGNESWGTLVFCYNRGANNKATITGGSIINNTSGKGPGAILLDSGSRLILSGGTITGNKSGTQTAGAVSIFNSETGDKQQDLIIGGSSNPLKIIGNRDTNNNVRNLMTISGKIYQRVSGSCLAEGSEIGVSMNNYPSAGNKTQFLASASNTEASYFKCDYRNKAGIVHETGLYLSADSLQKGDLYVNASYSGVLSDGSIDRPYKNLNDAYNNAVSGDTIKLLSNISTNESITITKDITVTSASDTVYTITKNNNSNLFLVSSGTLTLANVGIKANGKSNHTRTYALIKVNGSSSKLILNSGTTISDVGMSYATSNTEYGVLLIDNGATLTMNENAIIKDCTADSGPIRVVKSTFYMNGGTIENCDSKYSECNAVYIANGSSMIMSGGVIQNCGKVETGKPGTIFLHNNLGANNVGNSFIMSGGQIINNKATYGGGVYSQNSGNKIKVSGNAQIKDNIGTSLNNGESNIYLASGQTIEIGEDHLSEGAYIGCYTMSTPTTTTKVKIASNANESDAKYFHCDKPSKAGIEYDNTNIYLSIAKAEQIKASLDKVSLASGTKGTINELLKATIKIENYDASATYKYTVTNGRSCDGTVSNIETKNGITTATLSNLKYGDHVKVYVEDNQDNCVYFKVLNTDILNGNFESSNFGAALKTGSTIASWHTTAYDQNIEVNNDSTYSASPAPDGSKVAELNAYEFSTLYQEIDTSSKYNQTIYCNLYHRGRNGSDKMALVIGPTLNAGLSDPYKKSNSSTNDMFMTMVSNMESKEAGKTYTVEYDNKTYQVTIIEDGKQWAYYGGSYTVPQGQDETIFAFVSISATGGNDAIGNLLDGISFGTNTSLKYVAKINNTGYASLSGSDGAFAKANSNQTIELVGNPSSTESGTIKQDVTIKDTSGNTYKAFGESNVSVDTNGNVSLTSGSLEVNSNASIIVTFNNIKYTFSGSKYKVDTSTNTLTLEANQSVTDNNSIKYTGEGSFTFNDDKTISLSKDATISNNDSVVVGVQDTKVSIENNKLTLNGGKVSITGQCSAKVKVNNKIVEVKADTDKTVVIDADNKKVTNISENNSVTIDGVKYTSGSDNGEFSLVDTSLTKSNDKATLKTGEIKISYDDNKETTISISKDNSNDSIVTRNDGDSSVELKNNDKFVVNDNTYKAGCDNTKFIVDKDGNVSLETGKVVLIKDEGVGVDTLTIKDIGNGNTSVEVNDNYKKITVPGNGKIEIDKDDKKIVIENPSNTDLDANITSEGKLTVKTPVIIDNKKYIGEDITLTVNPGDGSISTSDGKTPNIEIDKDKFTGQLTLEKGQSVTIGDYTYIAPSDGNVTLTALDNSNPKVTIDKTVEIKKKNDSSTSSAYTANSSSTSFNVVDDASYVKLIEGQLKNINNETITDGTNPIKGINNNSVVGIVDDKLTLISGEVSIIKDSTVKVKTGDNQYKDVTSNGEDIRVDTSKATGVSKDKTVTIDGVKYTSGSDNGSFNLNNSQTFTNTNDKAEVGAGKSAIIELGNNKITVSSDNRGETIITKTDDGGTVLVVKKGDKFKVGNSEQKTTSDNAIYKVKTDGTIEALSGTISLSDGSSISGGSGKTITNPSGSNNDTVSVEINSPSNGNDKVTVPSSGKVNINDIEYENASTTDNLVIDVRKDSNKIVSGSVKLDKDGNIDLDDISIKNSSTDNSKDITVKANTDTNNKGTVTIPSGGKTTIKKGASETVIETTNAESTFTITSDTLKVKMPVKISGVEYSNTDSSAELTIDLSSGIPVVSVPKGTNVKDGNSTITTSENDAQVSKIDDSLTLLSGKGQVTGNVSVKISDDKTVNVAVASDNTITLDTSDKTVSGLGNDSTVTVDGITYTSGSDNGSFSLENAKLTNDGDKASIVTNVTSDKTIAVGNSLNIEVPGNDSGKVTITKTSTGATVSLEKSGDTFKVGNNTYTSDHDNTTYSVNNDGTASVSFQILKDGESYTGSSGKNITNPASSNNDEIKVTINSPTNNTDTLIIPANGKVKIGDNEYENASSSNNLIIEVSSSDNKVTSGSIKLDKNEDIKVTITDGSENKTLSIKNTDTSSSNNKVVVEAIKDNGDDSNKNSAKVTVPASGSIAIGDKVKITNTDTSNSLDISIGDDIKLSVNTPINVNGTSYTGDSDANLTIDPDTGKAVITVPSSGKKVTIGSDEYTSAADYTQIEKSDTTNKLINGAVKLNKDETISVGNSNTVVKNLEEGEATVTYKTNGTGEVRIPQGKKIGIGKAIIKPTDSYSSTTATINTEGKVEVTVPVIINDVEYSGDSSTKITVDPTDGKIISIDGDVTIDEKVLEDSNFSYDLKPNKTVTIGKYTYKNESTSNNVTINSRGKDANDKVLNPSITLIGVDDKVKVTLKDNSSSSTIYTASVSDTKFTMSDSDTDTKNIDLLDNNQTNNSRVKNIKEATVNGGDNSIKAIDENAQIELKDGKATLVSGKGSSNGGMTAIINNKNKTFSKTSGSDSYTVDLTNNKNTLTVPSGTTVKDKDGVRYSDGTYTFNMDDISVGNTATISSKENGDGSIIIGLTDTKVKVSEGNVSLISGSAKSSGKITTSINGNNKTFEKASGDSSYTVNATDKTLEVPENTSVKGDSVTYEKGKYTFNNDGSISITDNGKITDSDSHNLVVDGNAKIKLNTNEIELIEGKATVKGKVKSNLGNADHTFNSNGSYTIDKSNNKLIVPANTTVTDVNGIKYIGQGEYTFNNDTDKTISLNNGASIASKDDGGDGSVIIGLTDTKAKVTDGNVSLVSGNAKSSGKMIAVVNNSSKSFEKVTGESYTLNITNNTLEVPSNASVKSDGVTYEKGKYTFNDDGSVSITESGKIVCSNNTLVADSDSKVKVSNDSLELIEGKATVKGNTKSNLGNADYTFNSNGSYTIDKSNNKLIVPTGTTVTDTNGTKYIGQGEYSFNNDGTISLNTNATISANTSTVTAGDNNVKVKVTTNDDNKNIVELVEGKATVKGEIKTKLNGNYTFESIDDKEYTIDKSSNKLTITDGTTVKDDKGVIYKGTGSFSFNSDNTITVENGTTVTSKEGGNGTSVTGIGDASNPTVIKADDGSVILVGGKGESCGKMLVEFKDTNLGNQSFNGNGVSYTVDTSEADSSVTLNSGTDETNASIDLGNNIKLIGKKDDKFTLGSNNSKTTISIPSKAKITGKANSTIEGDSNTNVEIDSDGNLTLVDGKANVIGLSSIDVVIDTSKTVKVTASVGTTVIVDTNNKVVTGLSKDETVRIKDVVYTAIDGSNFSLDDYKLTNDGEKATVLGCTNEDVTIGLDALNITIPNGNNGDVSITKNTHSSIIEVSKKGDKFTIGNTTYTSKCDNALYSIDKDGNVKLINDSASLEKNESITGVSGKKITNNSDSEIKVTTDESKDTVLVPVKGGKVEIDDTEYETNKNNTIITIDKDGNTKLTGGSIGLDKDESIIGGNSDKLIKNPGTSKLIISIDDSKDIVTILDKANKVKIGDSVYESVIDNTKIEATNDINKLISGSIKLDKNESIIGGASNKEITNNSNNSLTITTDEAKDTVLVPTKGSNVKIDNTQYTTDSDNTVTTVTKDENVKLANGSIKLDKDGSIIGSSGKEIINTGNVTVTVTSDGVNDTVTVSSNGKVKIDNNTYEASSEGISLLVKENGTSVIKNSSETTSKVITCEEEMNSNNWTWSESKKACVYKVSNTETKWS